MRRPAWILPLAAMAMFWRQLFAGRVLVWGTALLQFHPWESLAVRLARAGTWPLWNPYNGNGAPLLANYQSALLYPPNWLYLLVPAEHGMGWLAALHVAWAGLGMYAFLRQLGLSRFAALAGALAFEFNGYLIARLTFLSITYAVAWLPWLFWAVERLIIRRRVTAAAVLALVVGLELLAGHAQTAAYGLAGAACYGLWRLVALQRAGEGRAARKALALAFAGGALGVALAAAQIVPTAELLMESQRARGVEREFGLFYSLWPWHLLTAFVPGLFGSPAAGTYWGYGYYHEEAIYAGLLPVLLAIGTAARCALRVAVRRHPQRATRDAPTRCAPFFVGLAVAALFFALGQNNPVYVWLFDHVPGVSAFQAPARISVLYVLAACVLAALGAAHWETSGPGPEGPRGRKYWARLGLAASTAAAAGLFVARGNLEGRMAVFAEGLVPQFALLAAIAILVLAQPGPDGGTRRLAWQAAVAGVVLLDLGMAGYGLNLAVAPDVYAGTTAAAEAVRAAGLGGERVLMPREIRMLQVSARLPLGTLGTEDTANWRSFREAGIPNTNLLDGLSSASNFESLWPARYGRLFEAADTDPARSLRVARLMAAGTLIWPDTPGARTALAHAGAGEIVYMGGATVAEGVLTGTMLYVRVPDALPRAYVVPTARVVPEPAMQLAAVLDPAFDMRHEVVLEQAPGIALPEPGDFQGTAEILQESADAVTIRARLSAPGVLVLVDTFYPGWEARVADRPAELLRANYAFRAVALPAGLNTVQFIYRPAGFKWGGVATLLAAGVLLGIGVKGVHAGIVARRA